MPHNIFVGAPKLEALAVTAPKVAGDVYQAVGYSLYQNAIINGGMQLSQRGNFTSASAVVDNTFYLDRMNTFISGISCNKQQTSITSSLPYPSCLFAFKMVTTGAATARYGVYQRVEQLQVFLGKTINFSAFVKANNSNTRLRLHDGVGYTYSAPATSDGTWQRLSVTHTVSVSATALRCSVTQDNAAVGNVSIASGDYLETTGWVLNVGTVALPYQPRLFNDEWMLCMRYYEKSYAYFTALGASDWNGVSDINVGTATTNNIGINVWFKVPKVTPASYTIYYWDPAGTPNVCYKGSGSKPAAVGERTTENGFWWRTNDATNAAEIALHWAVDSEIV